MRLKFWPFATHPPDAGALTLGREGASRYLPVTSSIPPVTARHGRLLDSTFEVQSGEDETGGGS